MFKELSRNVFHCSVIMVLCLATAFIVYHFVFALSRIFLPDFQKVFFKHFCFSLFYPFSATTRLVYHYVFCLSTCFLTFLFISLSRRFCDPAAYSARQNDAAGTSRSPGYPATREVPCPGNPDTSHALGSDLLPAPALQSPRRS